MRRTAVCGTDSLHAHHGCICSEPRQPKRFGLPHRGIAGEDPATALGSTCAAIWAIKAQSDLQLCYNDRLRSRMVYPRPAYEKDRPTRGEWIR